MFTTYLESASKLEQLTGHFNCEYREGRAAAAPKLKKDKNGPEDALHVSASPQSGSFYATCEHGQ